jgi:hypothetical protein
MSSSLGTRARRTISAVGVVGAVSLLIASCITNAGMFTLGIENGSAVALHNAEGEPTLSFAYSDTKACADGIDNDVDERIDGADPQCDSTTDNNERLDGVQTVQAPELHLDVKAVGDVIFEPSHLVFPQAEVCVDLGLLGGVVCVGATLHGAGGSQTGHIDTGTRRITMTLPLVVDLDALVGLSGFGTNCAIGPFDVDFVSTDYDILTGEATLVAQDVPVAAVSNCGSLYNGFINDLAGLPGTADISWNTTILNGEGDPLEFAKPETTTTTAAP